MTTNETVSITLILGIGERTHKVLEYIRECIKAEELDLHNNFCEQIEFMSILLHFNKLYFNIKLN